MALTNVLTIPKNIMCKGDATNAENGMGLNHIFGMDAMLFNTVLVIVLPDVLNSTASDIMFFVTFSLIPAFCFLLQFARAKDCATEGKQTSLA